MFEDKVEAYVEGEESKFHYYYNREERLARAPQSVRDYYEGKMKPVTGIKIFVANRSNRFILFALVIFIAFAWIYSGLNRTRSYASTGKVCYDMQAFSYGEEIFVSIKVFSKSSINNPVPVSTTLYLIDNDNQIVQEETLSLVFDGEEKFFRTKFSDYDIIRVDAEITGEGVSKELSAFIKR